MMMAAWIDIALVASTLTSGLAVLLALLCSVRQRRQARLTRQLYQQLQRELQVANSGAMGMGRRLVGVERRLKSTVHRQQQFEQQGENQASYSEAITLFDTGIDAAEVARRCNLSQAEASLMEMMHRHMKDGRRATWA
ncbi:DUF2802 domain-containing protein [Exilibacterium tricleocarpae]|uniref:DUF2802 domain-containing protein n=1 Tax=Exilibacterium tricleocarpae TaxID=2591008 RepID=A0A545U407_9GAMM|nr:DUF2802 domain-containing protein [Exilibacterium tricleocarpae]TQV84199.1 DUF2802 domain-containing protein [Exilibacterium tricleocarpae]